MTKSGLFIGAATLDLIYLTANFPQSNEKIVALKQTVAAGGPATNAAVTFNYLGNQATLIAVIGSHPISHLIRADLQARAVKVVDLGSQREEPPPVSSIIVTQERGDRAAISINAPCQASVAELPADILQTIKVVLIDGHQMAVGEFIARQAKASCIPIVIDGGSWKLGFEKVLPFVDYAICSANFYPPGCRTHDEVIAYLETLGVAQIAITQGEKPIIYQNNGYRGTIAVPEINAVDTLGAGDIFHGAFCHYILQQEFVAALAAAAQVASRSCQFFGSRQWMQLDEKK